MRAFSVRGFVVVAALLVVAGCQTINSESDRLTWLNGIVVNPNIGNKCSYGEIGNKYTQKECLVPGSKNAKVPAVVFLHGCAGINNRQFNVMKLFTSNGYVTFMPDSFARPGRMKACGSSRDVLHLRVAEIKYALSQIRKISWIDSSRLVLAGFSEGGIVAAEYGGTEFKVRVVMGWGCGTAGISGDEPVLNLVGINDNESRGGNSLCYVGSGRKNSFAQHVNAGHDVSNDPESKTIIKKFLEKVL